MLKSMTNTNLPSLWTKEKMTNLLLLSGFSNLVNAGQVFENCLITLNEGNIIKYNYSALLNYPFASNSAINNGQEIQLCCNTAQCAPPSNPSNTSVDCSIGDVDGELVQCTEIGGTIACDQGCEGVVKNTTITGNNTLNPISCPSDLTTVANYISSLPTSDIAGLAQGYAHYHCDNGPCTGSSLYCGWDNGGWTCFTAQHNTVLNCEFDSVGNFACPNGCTFQWTAPWPGSPENNPFILTTSSSTNSIPYSETNNIPLIIVTTVGGTTLLTTGGVTFAYCLTKKKREREKAREQQNIGIELSRYPSIQSLVTDSESRHSINAFEPPTYSQAIGSSLSQVALDTVFYQTESNQLVAQVEQRSKLFNF